MSMRSAIHVSALSNTCHYIWHVVTGGWEGTRQIQYVKLSVFVTLLLFCIIYFLFELFIFIMSSMDMLVWFPLKI